MKEFVNSFLTVVLGRGAALAIVRIVFDRRKDRRERLDAIKYLALQLAFQFEGFAIECERVASDNQTADEHGGNVGRFISGVPQPQPLPASDAYRFLEPEILNRVFGFAQRCQMAQQAASVWAEIVGDEQCYRSASEENTIMMGAECLQIAGAIRRKYRLGDRTLEFDKWSIDNFFKKELPKIEARKARRDEATKEGTQAD